MPLRYWGLIFVLGLGWGSAMFFNEILLRELGPLQTALGRVGFGALGCRLWLAATGRRVRVSAGFLRDATVITAWSLMAGTLVLAPVALAVEGVPRIERAETWAALLFIGFVLTAASFFLLFWLLQRVGATTTSTITFITLVSAVLLGVLFLDERLLPAHLIGIAVIFAGLLLIDGRLLRRAGFLRAA